MSYSLFDKSAIPEEIVDKIAELSEEETGFSRIRCPKCSWQPTKASRWWCADCGFPEYFSNACYSSWNTFETRGLCLVCLHQWRWTSCLSCGGWSLHEDWYAGDDKD